MTIGGSECSLAPCRVSVSLRQRGLAGGIFIIYANIHFTGELQAMNFIVVTIIDTRPCHGHPHIPNINIHPLT